MIQFYQNIKDLELKTLHRHPSHRIQHLQKSRKLHQSRTYTKKSQRDFTIWHKPLCKLIFLVEIFFWIIKTEWWMGTGIMDKKRNQATCLFPAQMRKRPNALWTEESDQSYHFCQTREKCLLSRRLWSVRTHHLDHIKSNPRAKPKNRSP